MSGTDDDSRVEDAVRAELNPGEQQAVEALPARPADGASKATWVDYVVALGADRALVEGESKHWDGEAYAPVKALTREQLHELATTLGG